MKKFRENAVQCKDIILHILSEYKVNNVDTRKNVLPLAKILSEWNICSQSKEKNVLDSGNTVTSSRQTMSPLHPAKH